MTDDELKANGNNNTTAVPSSASTTSQTSLSLTSATLPTTQPTSLTATTSSSSSMSDSSSSSSASDETNQNKSTSSTDQSQSLVPNGGALAINLDTLDLHIPPSATTNDSALERNLSAVYLSMHQLQQTRTAISYALNKGLVTPTQVNFFLAYLGAVMVPEDFHQLLHPTMGPSLSIPASNLTPSLGLTVPDPYLSPTRSVYSHQYIFNFGYSPLEAVEDSASLGMDFPTLQIIRIEDPTKTNQPSTTTANQNTDTTNTNNTSITSTTTNNNASNEQTASSAINPTVGPIPYQPQQPSQISTAAPPSIQSSSSAFTPVSPGTNAAAIAAAQQHQQPARPIPLSSSLSATTPSSSSSPINTPPISSATQSADSSSTSASSATSTSASTSTTNTTTNTRPEIFLVVRVNREFERLFGHSQRLLRDLFTKEGGKVLYRLLAPSSLPILSKWLTDAMLGGKTEFRSFVTIVNKYCGRTECLMYGRYLLDNAGLFKQCAYCFIPLPEEKQRNGA